MRLPCSNTLPLSVCGRVLGRFVFFPLPPQTTFGWGGGGKNEYFHLSGFLGSQQIHYDCVHLDKLFVAFRTQSRLSFLQEPLTKVKKNMEGEKEEKQKMRPQKLIIPAHIVAALKLANSEMEGGTS